MVQMWFRTLTNSETGDERVLYCPTLPYTTLPYYTLLLHTPGTPGTPLHTCRTGCQRSTDCGVRRDTLGSEAPVSLGEEAWEGSPGPGCHRSSEVPPGLRRTAWVDNVERLDRIG